MAADVTKEDFKHLETRVDIVEREVEGEKMVTRHILEQTRRNGDDLAAIKSRLDRHDQRFDALERRFDGLDRKVGGMEQKVDGLEQKVGGLESKVESLRKDLPRIVGDVMREVLQERDKKR